MIPSKHYLLYAQMHTRKYTTATYKPSAPTEEVRRKVQKAGAGIVCYVSSHGEVGMTSIHEGELSTKYGVEFVLTLENSNTGEIHTLTVPGEKVTVYRDLTTDVPYVFVGINKETNEPNYEIHVGTLIQDKAINLLHPTKED